MNKTELVTALAERTGYNKGIAADLLDGLLGLVGDTLAKGEKIALVGFGTFETQHRAARSGRNPQTGEALQIPESVLPKFSPGKLLKDQVAEAHKPKAAPVAKAKKPKVEKAENAPAKPKPKAKKK